MTMFGRNLYVTVLAGGISAEREISLLSGRQIAEALECAGHSVWISDISPTDLSALDHIPCDVVFPALHGFFGEDGQVQKILEQREIPFVGSGSFASEISMNKAIAKGYMTEADIPTPKWQVVYQDNFGNSWHPMPYIGYPCMVKPLKEGSSVGCRKCHDLSEVMTHLAEMLPKYGAMMVESFIKGFELTVGIIDGSAMPPIWIRTTEGWYDYQAKYFRNDTEYVFDKIPLSDKLLPKIQEVAIATHRTLGCKHISRVDFIVDLHTQQPYVLEINTMPGFTEHSLLPKAAAKVRIPLSTLCDKLVHMAIRDIPARLVV